MYCCYIMWFGASLCIATYGSDMVRCLCATLSHRRHHISARLSWAKVFPESQDTATKCTCVRHSDCCMHVQASQVGAPDIIQVDYTRKAYCADRFRIHVLLMWHHYLASGLMSRLQNVLQWWILADCRHTLVKKCQREAVMSLSRHLI